MKFIYCFVCFVVFTTALMAGTVDTVSIYSNSMHKYIKAVVIKPDSYSIQKKSFPVVYLLHGYDGWYSNWIIRVPELKEHADTYQTLIVCPDGAISSWYFDSPVDTSYRYETHISSELVSFVDSHYRTFVDKGHRAITGLSMGGHGALLIGLKHSDIFGAAGSMSGVFDLWENRKRYDISKRIGDTTINPAAWHDLSVINLIENYSGTGVQIIFDCGEKDMFINANRRLHQKNAAVKNSACIYRKARHAWLGLLAKCYPLSTIVLSKVL